MSAQESVFGPDSDAFAPKRADPVRGPEHYAALGAPRKFRIARPPVAAWSGHATLSSGRFEGGLGCPYWQTAR